MPCVCKSWIRVCPGPCLPCAMCCGMCLEKLNPCLPCFPCALLEKVKPSLIWISALLQLLQTPKDIHHSARKLVNNGPNLRWRRWWWWWISSHIQTHDHHNNTKNRSKILKGTPGKTKRSKFLNERNRAVGKWSHQTINQRKYVQCLSSKLTSKKIWSRFEKTVHHLILFLC